MSIYEKTNNIIVRDIEKTDIAKYLEYIEECGNYHKLTHDELEDIWRSRKKQGAIQCIITSPDGSKVYGFCGVLGFYTQTIRICIDLFKKYKKIGCEKDVREIMFRKGLEKARM